MKKENKSLILLLVCVLSMLCLVACGTKKYTVTFKNGDTVVASVTVEEGFVVTDQAVTDEVHEFIGWYDENGKLYDFNNAVTSDITLTAKWTNTVKFVNYDGEVLSQVEVKEGETIEAPAKNPTKASDSDYNYTFTGWDKALVGTGNDETITATYSSASITYTVSYYNNNNELITTKEVVKGQKAENIAGNDISDDYYDYTFKTWTTEDGNEYDFNSVVNKDTKLVAKYDRTPIARKSLTGMKVSLMGASISTFYSKSSKMNSYYSGNDEFYYPKYSSSVQSVTLTWWYKMINQLGLKLGVNQSLSGSAVTVGEADKQAQSYTRIRAMGENGDPDIIILFIGINDNVSGVSNENFEAGYRTMIDRCEEVYPNAYILLATFYYSHYHIRMASHGSYSEETRLAYNAIIRNLADEYQVGLVELADVWEAGVSPTEGDSGSKGYLGDNLHPSATGMTAISKVFIADMKKYFGITK